MTAGGGVSVFSRTNEGLSFSQSAATATGAEKIRIHGEKKWNKNQFKYFNESK